MPTADQILWLRDDVGTTETALPDSEAEALFTRAEAISSVYEIQEPLTRIYYIRSLLANSAKLTSYRQNLTQESASDVFKHLKDLLTYWEAKLEDAYTDEAAGSDGAARSGRQTQKPARYGEYPNSG